MKTIDINSFFEEFTIKDDMNNMDYKQFIPVIDALDATARISHVSLYVIDYYKKNFFYVSPNSLFLCGHMAEEVLQMGYMFYQKVIPIEDLEMLLEINKKGFYLFYQYPVKLRMGFSISYDFRMVQPDSKALMVNHKLTPISITPNGDLWLALCVVTLSTQRKPGNVYIKNGLDLHYYSYSFKGKKWKDYEFVSLSSREQDVLKLATQGCTNNEIAETLYIDLNTVKSHKKHIFEKLNVKNVGEAITYAQNNKLIY